METTNKQRNKIQDCGEVNDFTWEVSHGLEGPEVVEFGEIWEMVPSSKKYILKLKVN